MRGSDERSGSLFSYVDLEARVRGDHPLRTIREIANAALNDLSRAFAAIYTDFGRPSIAPETHYVTDLDWSMKSEAAARPHASRPGRGIGEGEAPLLEGQAAKSISD